MIYMDLRFRDERRESMNKKREQVTRANFGIWMMSLTNLFVLFLHLLNFAFSSYSIT
jgi:hypothetical protein